jgi:[protein-PII] uridylyltransferase
MNPPADTPQGPAADPGSSPPRPESLSLDSMKAALPPLKERANQGQLASCRAFLHAHEDLLARWHEAGGGGTAVATARSDLINVLLGALLEDAAAEGRANFTLVATGGFGRGQLQPHSDLDLLFLVHGNAAQVTPAIAEEVRLFLLVLYDLKFAVGHATRTVGETLRQANLDNETKSALIERRWVGGPIGPFEALDARFWKACIAGKEASYLEQREHDLRMRHAKFGGTPFLQEPNVKEGCGGLRDHHNLNWMTYVKTGQLDLNALVKLGMISPLGLQELTQAYEFLMRVRTDLHLIEGRERDVLTLLLQGQVASRLGYPQKTILRRIEVFMRDYYTHARNVLQRSSEVMDGWHQAHKGSATNGKVLFGLLGLRHAQEEARFDGFIERLNRLYAANDKVFSEDPGRLLRVFHHAQVRGLRLSPELFRLIEQNLGKVDRDFRNHKAHRAIFEAILSRKGRVATSLRQMHRAGFLGAFLPEFGDLTCLVQHEFFHRFTADEHTLTCIDRLDELADPPAEDDPPARALMSALFRDVEAPFEFYLALLLHDAGRAENAPRHEDSSAEMAVRVARRFRIMRERRQLLLFLVDHHLTMWRTATTKNLDEPAVVEEFALAIKDQRRLDHLLLFTYVDSRATSESSWSTWKESLILQLYRSASHFLTDAEGYRKSYGDAPEGLRSAVEKRLRPSYSAEVDAHFQRMPARYFHCFNSISIADHIRQFRVFFRQLKREEGIDAHQPLVRWLSHPHLASSELLVACWDRSELLAKVTGALAACDISVLSAQLFRREDDLVLNVFHVCTSRLTAVDSLSTQRKVKSLLARACREERVDFDQLIQQPKGLLAPKPATERTGVDVPRRVYVSSTTHPTDTIIEIQTADEIGLLYRVCSIVSSLGLEIAQARIATEKGAAIDVLHLRDHGGHKVTDPARLAALQGKLAALVGAERQRFPPTI